MNFALFYRFFVWRFVESFFFFILIIHNFNFVCQKRWFSSLTFEKLTLFFELKMMFTSVFWRRWPSFQLVGYDEVEQDEEKEEKKRSTQTSLLFSKKLCVKIFTSCCLMQKQHKTQNKTIQHVVMEIATILFLCFVPERSS